MFSAFQSFSIFVRNNVWKINHQTIPYKKVQVKYNKLTLVKSNYVKIILP